MKTENLVYNIHQKHYLTKNNNKRNANQTTAGVNPSGRLSFKGSAASEAAKAAKKLAHEAKLNKLKEAVRNKSVEELEKTFGGKLAKNKAFNKFLDIVSSNTLIADALIALFLTAVARPASIYAIPTKDPVEKKKNNYQVAHSAATGLLGLGFTMAIAEPIKRGVMKIIDEPSKYIKKGDSSYVSKNERVFRETAVRIHQPLFLPIRAAVSILMVKPILDALGLDKNGKGAVSPQTKAKIDYSFMSFKGTDKKAFKKFSNLNVNVQKTTDSVAANTQTPSFKGAGGQVTELIAQGIGKIGETNSARKFINWFAKKDNWFPHLIAGESLWLSGFYMQQTAKSKKIEKDQKLPMMLNQGITAVLCTLGAYKLDGLIKDKLDVYKEVYKKMNPEMEAKSKPFADLLKKYANDKNMLKALKNDKKYETIRKAYYQWDNKMMGIRLLGPVVIFTVIYRFIGPVVITPLANKLSEWIEPHNKKAA